jgi:hypothetical protein
LDIVDFPKYHHPGYFRNGEYPHQLNSYDSFFEALKSMLLDDADKLYEQLLKEQTDTIISSYASDESSSLISTTLASNQRSEVGITGSEIYHNDKKIIK